MIEKVMKERKASYTIEAALIFPFILTVIVLIIYTGFYLHDRAVLDAICFEAALRGSEVRLEDADIYAVTRNMTELLLKDSLLATKNLDTKIEVTSDQVSVTCIGELNIPKSVILVPGYDQTELTVGASRSCTRFCQTDFVRKCRMAENLKKSAEQGNAD